MSRSRNPRRPGRSDPSDRRRAADPDPFEQVGGAPASGEIRPEDELVDADPTLLEEELPGPEEPEDTAAERPSGKSRPQYAMPETAPADSGRAPAHRRAARPEKGGGARPKAQRQRDPSGGGRPRPQERRRDPRWADPGSEPPAKAAPLDPFELVASRSARETRGPDAQATTAERPAATPATPIQAQREQITRATLLMAAGPEPGRAFALGDAQTVVVGRSSECDIAIPDLSVSRRHAELRRLPDGGWEVRDAGSRNGIAVDNAPADGWTPLPSGAVLGIGDVRLRFESVRGFSDDVHAAIETMLRRSETDQLSVSPSQPLEPPRPASPGPLLDRRVSVAAPPEPERQPFLSPFALKAVLGIAAAGLVAVVGAAVLWPGDRLDVSPVAGKAPPSSVDGLIATARAHAAAHRWKEAQDAYRAVLAAAPTEPEALEMIVEAPQEGRAYATLLDAQAAFDGVEWARAVRTARRVPEKSRYRADAEALLERIETDVLAPRLAAARDLIEAGEGQRALEVEIEPVLDIYPGHPEASELLDAVRSGRRLTRPSPAPKPTPRARRSARNRPAARARPAQASSEPDPIVADARRAFAGNRVSDARAAAEAAADADVDGAARLSRELRSYDQAVTAGDAALKGRQVAAALGHFTEALILARRVTPGGGQPAKALQARLAELHYLEALRALERQERGAARGHLDKSLRYDPGHSKARELLGRL